MVSEAVAAELAVVTFEKSVMRTMTHGFQTVVPPQEGLQADRDAQSVTTEFASTAFATM